MHEENNSNVKIEDIALEQIMGACGPLGIMNCKPRLWKLHVAIARRP